MTGTTSRVVLGRTTPLASFAVSAVLVAILIPSHEPVSDRPEPYHAALMSGIPRERSTCGRPWSV